MKRILPCMTEAACHCGRAALHGTAHCAYHVTATERTDLTQRAATAQDQLARLRSTDPAVRAAALADYRAQNPDKLPAVRQPVGQAAIVCPHCQVQGRVTTRHVKQKKGVSGGKATGAVLTGGFSLLATGLSRKEKATECRCGNCGMKWTV